MGVAVVMTFVIFVLTTVLVLLDTKDWTAGFFAVTITSVIVINIFSAILQGGLFGFAGMLPPRYTQAVMGGQVIHANALLYSSLTVCLRKE